MKIDVEKIENNTNDIIRELLILWMAILIFPFITIRIFIWNWYIWIEKNLNNIRIYKDKLNM